MNTYSPNGENLSFLSFSAELFTHRGICLKNVKSLCLGKQNQSV